MKFKGAYNQATSYDVGDAVVFDRWLYHLQKPCKAGTTPTDTLYWGKAEQNIAQTAVMFMDLMEMEDTDDEAIIAQIPKNIDDESIVLKSGDNEYLITVDASGETPELVVELIEPDDDDDDDAAEGGEE